MSLTLTYKGFNYVDFYNGIYEQANLDATLPEVAATGADSVALTPDFGIDVATSTVYAGSGITDTTSDLTAAVDKATAEGLTSLVRPLIDILYPQVSPNNGAPNYYVPDNFTSIFDPDGTGATTIAYNPATNNTYAADTPAGVTPATIPIGTPDSDFVNYRGLLETTDEAGGDLNAATFFGGPTTVGSYDYMIVQEAKTAAAAGAKLFSVGTELDGLADDPADKTYWESLIADVRAAAPSLKLTYSANWSNASQVTFWNKLDYVGLDGYVPLSNTIPDAQNNNNPSLASLIAGWNTASSVQIAYSGGETVSQDLGGLSAIDAFDTLAQQSIDKQFIFTELGYQNDTGAANDPTGGSATGVPDPSLQAELYTAFFDAWGQAQTTAAGHGGLVDGVPYSLAGAYFWDYVPDGSNDGWSPELNPLAAAVINSNFASPVVVVAETNVAGLAGPMGSPTAARGTAGTSGTGALAGDSDTNGAALSISAISGGTVGTSFNTKYGSLDLNANGSYTYFAEPSAALADAPTGAPAADAITFTVTDTNGATATSTLTISDYRDPTVVAENASTRAGVTISGTAGTSGTGALAGDTDPDGASLSVVAINDLGEPLSNPIAGKYGTLTLNPDGSYSYVADSVAALASAFSADNGAPLTDGFTILVYGGVGTFSQSSLDITLSKQTATSDFNGDGKADVPLYSTNGTYVDWTMNGPQITAAQPLTYQGNTVSLDASWCVAGVGDFNGDGKADILLHNTNGTFVDWTMNGPQITAAQPLTYQGNTVSLDASWSVAGVGDFNGDGKAGILLYNTNGTYVDWTMNGPQVTAAQPLTYQGNTVSLGNTWHTETDPATGGVGAQLVASGSTVSNPTIAGGTLDLMSGAIVNGPITFTAGTTGTLLDADQANLPDTVMGFTETADYLSFSGDSSAGIASVVASQQLVNGNTVLTFPDHTSITLVGITHADANFFS